MTPVEHATMRAVEDEFWWYRALRQHVADSIEPPKANFTLLDVGCGTGGMLALLRRRFPESVLTGLDLSGYALELTGQRGAGAVLVQSTAERLPFRTEEFDIAISLDLLASAAVNDEAAIGEMYRVLRPGGRLLVNLPALELLKGSHDVAVGMARRYTRRRLAALLASAGFGIERITYWNTTLLPAIALVRWLSRVKMNAETVRSDLVPLWWPVNHVLATIARTELALSACLPLPFGSSLFAIATK